MKCVKISIADDFSKYPGPRFIKLGDWSGELFRNNYLVPELDKLGTEDILEINLDGTKGFGSSFLEECFGGLVRNGYKDKISQIEFKSDNDPSVILEIKSYIKDEVEKRS